MQPILIDNEITPFTQGTVQMRDLAPTGHQQLG